MNSPLGRRRKSNSRVLQTFHEIPCATHNSDMSESREYTNCCYTICRLVSGIIADKSAPSNFVPVSMFSCVSLKSELFMRPIHVEAKSLTQ